MRGSFEPSVSVVMVVRNEEQVLEQKLKNLFALHCSSAPYQIIVVSDASTDRTETILGAHERDSRLHVVFNRLPRGKAACLNDGIELAQGQVVVFTDARQYVEPDAIQRLSENFADPEVGAASGELMLGDPNSDQPELGMGLYWRVEKIVRELESVSSSVVGATGALYAVRRELLTVLPEGTILDDVYLPMQVVRQGKRVVFDERARAWDAASLGTAREFSRKVRTLSGNYQLLQLAPWLLRSSNRIRFEFISHKLLRLAMPLALGLLFLSSLMLYGPVYRVALIVQLLFYALSVAALARLLQDGPLAGAAKAAATFVLLNTAAVVAFVNFVRGRKPVWIN
jgi:cellulose synthase/poly-beta-1,6-N-acetylglucosamine synthase-like glycosyltransferase